MYAKYLIDMLRPKPYIMVIADRGDGIKGKDIEREI